METSTELRLGLPGTEELVVSVSRGDKRPIAVDSRECNSSFVGWPPVGTFRKNKFQCRPKKTKSSVHAGDTCMSSPGLFVKVGMDGVPYLRKIDLNIYAGYKELRQALDAMFKCFSVEFTVAYEDKDGDWMLAGDVPWRMFVCSCKRLRIMKD